MRFPLKSQSPPQQITRAALWGLKNQSCPGQSAASQQPCFPLGLKVRPPPEHDPPQRRPCRAVEAAHLFPIFFLHTVHTFSSVMMHFTCWCKIRSSWTWEDRDIAGKSHELTGRVPSLKQLQLTVKMVQVVFKEHRALPLSKEACGNCLTLKSSSPPWGLQGSYPQEFCMEKVLKHLIEPFLLSIFF